VNQSQIPLPCHFASVEFYKVFFSKRGEELDDKKRVARSFFVHESGQIFGAYPLTTKSVCDKVVYIMERKRLENNLVHNDSGFADRVQRQHQRMRWTYFVVPISADNQEVFNIGMIQEMFDEAESSGVQPLKVIEKKGERMFFPSKNTKESSEDRLKPILRFLRR
jgi:hypothetical protein